MLIDDCATIGLPQSRGRLAPFERFKQLTTEGGVAPHPAASRHLLPASGGREMIRLEPRFAELAATTNFSFLRGASHPEEMVARAAELGLAGIGIADRNTLAGVVRAHVFARENKAALAGMRVVLRRAARLRRRDARPPRLSEGPRGLRPALPDSHGGKFARAEGRVPSARRGSHRARRGAADRGASLPLPLAGEGGRRAGSSGPQARKRLEPSCLARATPHP